MGSEKDGGHRARVQSIAVSGNNVHVFAVKYVFSFNFFFSNYLIADNYDREQQ